jgi:hypothetical protein
MKFNETSARDSLHKNTLIMVDHDIIVKLYYIYKIYFTRETLLCTLSLSLSLSPTLATLHSIPLYYPFLSFFLSFHNLAREQQLREQQLRMWSTAKRPMLQVSQVEVLATIIQTLLAS